MQTQKAVLAKIITAILNGYIFKFTMQEVQLKIKIIKIKKPTTV